MLHHRHREQDVEASVRDAERYGEPVRSLFVSTKSISLRQDTDIADERGEVAYHTTTKPLSLKDKTDVTDAQGAQVAHIERKVLTLHEYHRVEMADGRTFDVSNELLHLVRDTVSITELGWHLHGNVAALSFELVDENADIIAVIGQRSGPATDRYCVDIYQGEFEAEVVAILVVLQHTMRDREAAATSFATSTS